MREPLLGDLEVAIHEAADLRLELLEDRPVEVGDLVGVDPSVMGPLMAAAGGRGDVPTSRA